MQPHITTESANAPVFFFRSSSPHVLFHLLMIYISISQSLKSGITVWLFLFIFYCWIIYVSQLRSFYFRIANYKIIPILLIKMYSLGSSLIHKHSHVRSNVPSKGHLYFLSFFHHLLTSPDLSLLTREDYS